MLCGSLSVSMLQTLIFMGPEETRIGNVADRLCNAVCYNKTSATSKDATNLSCHKKEINTLMCYDKVQFINLLPRATI